MLAARPSLSRIFVKYSFTRKYVCTVLQTKRLSSMGGSITSGSNRMAAIRQSGHIFSAAGRCCDPVPPYASVLALVAAAVKVPSPLVRHSLPQVEVCYRFHLKPIIHTLLVVCAVPSAFIGIHQFRTPISSLTLLDWFEFLNRSAASLIRIAFARQWRLSFQWHDIPLVEMGLPSRTVIRSLTGFLNRRIQKAVRILLSSDL